MEKIDGLRGKLKIFSKSLKLLFEASKGYTILIFLLSILHAITAPISAVIYQKFLDFVVQMVNNRVLIREGCYLLLLMTLFSLISFSLNGILNFTNQVLGDKLDIYVTDRVLKKATLLPMETFDNAEVYNHINRAVTQSSSSCLQLLQALADSVYAFFKGISFIYILVRFNWMLVVFSLITIFPLLRLSTRINKYWYKIYYNRSEKKRFNEYLKKLMVKNESVKEIRLYNVAEKIRKLVKGSFVAFLREDIPSRVNFLSKRVGVQWIDEVASLIAKFWILILGLKRGCSLGTIMLYFSSLENLKMSYAELVDQFSTLQNSLLYMESFETLTQEQEINLGGEKIVDSQLEEIEFRNVSFRYPGCEKFVLKNINMKFKRGKTYFIIGFNGSGKTTLIKLLLRLYKPTKGQILIGGKDIEEYDLNSYYSNISAIFQDFIKYPFSVNENIAIRPHVKEESRVYDALRCVGMDQFVEGLPQREHTLLLRDWSGGVEISQGQWQKLAIARCIFGDSIISILDEPFSSIDAEAENFIIANIRKSSHDKLTIFITHRFSSILPTDIVFVLKDGEIVEQGTSHDLVEKKGIYYRLNDKQQLGTINT